MRLAWTVLLVLLLAGCAAPQAAPPPEDKFPEDASAGHAFVVNATGAERALHLDVAREGRVAYRVLAWGDETVRVDACLMPGRDADLWWANHTVPVKACQHAATIARQGATLTPGTWSLVLRAYGCQASCNLTAVVVGATVIGSSEGPADLSRVDALPAERCAICA